MLERLSILALMMAADVFCWWRIDTRLRRLSYSRLWRAGIGTFFGLQVAYALWLVPDLAVPEARPLAWPTASYIWHVLFLPILLLGLLGAQLLKLRRRQSPKFDLAPTRGAVSRRDLITAAATIAPPLVTMLATGKALAQTGTFSVRSVDLRIPHLPPDLDGVTIAHVTDLHFGRFMPSQFIAPIADATNALECDFVAMTGDLLDHSAYSIEPGIQFLHRLRPRHGIVLIEGNHDVNRECDRFEHGMADAGFPPLLDQARTFRIPGRTTPIQFLGIAWGYLRSGAELDLSGEDRYRHYRKPSEEARWASIKTIAGLRQPDAFPIVLAHHPHAFDPGAVAGFPLMLSGHTHGGQLMITPDIGFGPLRFKYWTGLYQKPGSQLFISNGIGSWFPLRVNAPPEIVKLTLRRG
jgi:hypothetical protein